LWGAGRPLIHETPGADRPLVPETPGVRLGPNS
jgi:hypothetical protein